MTRRADQTTFKQLIDDVKSHADLVALIGRDVELWPSCCHHVCRWRIRS